MPFYEAVSSMGTIHGKDLQVVLPMMHFTLLLRDDVMYGIALAELKSADKFHSADVYVTLDVEGQNVTMGPWPVDYDEMKTMKQMVPFPSIVMGQKAYLNIRVEKK